MQVSQEEKGAIVLPGLTRPFKRHEYDKVSTIDVDAMQQNSRLATNLSPLKSNQNTQYLTQSYPLKNDDELLNSIYAELDCQTIEAIDVGRLTGLDNRMQKDLRHYIDAYYVAKKGFQEPNDISRKSTFLIKLTELEVRIKLAPQVAYNYNDGLYTSDGTAQVKSQENIDFLSSKIQQIDILSKMKSLFGNNNLLSFLQGLVYRERGLLNYFAGNAQCIDDAINAIIATDTLGDKDYGFTNFTRCKVTPQTQLLVYLADQYIDKSDTDLAKILAQLNTIKSFSPSNSNLKNATSGSVSYTHDCYNLAIEIANMAIQTCSSVLKKESANFESDEKLFIKCDLFNLLVKKSYLHELIDRNDNDTLQVRKKIFEQAKGVYEDIMSNINKNTTLNTQTILSSIASLSAEIGCQLTKFLVEFRRNFKFSERNTAFNFKLAQDTNNFYNKFFQKDNDFKFAFYNNNFKEIQYNAETAYIFQRLPLSLTNGSDLAPTLAPAHFTHVRALIHTPEGLHIDNLLSNHRRCIVSADKGVLEELNPPPPKKKGFLTQLSQFLQ